MLNEHTLSDLLDLQLLQRVLDQVWKTASIPACLISADKELLHSPEPYPAAPLAGPLPFAQARLQPGNRSAQDIHLAGELRQICLPLLVKGELLGTVVLGNFFYREDTLSKNILREIASAYGLDPQDCRERLNQVPRLQPDTLTSLVDGLRVQLDLIAALIQQNLEQRQQAGELTQAQNALAELNERYQTIFNGMLDGILIETPDGQILDGNEAAFHMHGYQRSEMLKLHVADLVAPGHPIIYPMPSADLSTPVEGMNRRKDGSVFPIELSARSVELERRTVLLVVIRDISARKKVEEEAQRTRKRLELALEATEAGLWDWDLPSGLHYVSPRWYRMLGYSLNEIQPNYETFLSLVHPDDVMRVRHMISQHISGRHAFYESEFRMRKRDGNWVWVLSRGRVTEHDEDGKPLRMIGTHIDISLRKSAEAALRASEEKFYKSFQTSPDSIKIIRIYDNAYLDVNEGFVKIFGFTRDEIIGKTCGDPQLWVYPEEYEQLKQTLSKNGEVQGLEATFRVWDGSTFTGQISGRLIELNETECMLIITRDITERKRNEELLRDAHLRLEWAYEATLQGWNRALEMRDVATKRHSERCIDLTIELAQEAGLSGEELTFVRYGVILHDIGKLAIPDFILNKPGPLNAQEWAIMRRHSFYAEEMLQGIDYLQPALPMITSHHERWDGNGYPLGLEREEIPLTARIFSIVDIWDSMTHDRPWRRGVTPDEARAYIRDNAGFHFDPDLVQKFFKVLDRYSGRS